MFLDLSVKKSHHHPDPPEHTLCGLGFCKGIPLIFSFIGLSGGRWDEPLIFNIDYFANLFGNPTHWLLQELLHLKALSAIVFFSKREGIHFFLCSFQLHNEIAFGTIPERTWPPTRINVAVQPSIKDVREARKAKLLLPATWKDVPESSKMASGIWKSILKVGQSFSSSIQ